MKSRLISEIFLKTIIVISVILVASLIYLPLFSWLIREWLYNPFYGHGFLIPIITSLLLYLRRGYLRLTSPDYKYLILIAIGLGVHLTGFLTNNQYFSAFSFPIVLAATIAYLCGTKNIKKLAFPLLLLFLMIPMPFMDQLTFRLQSLTTWSTVMILNGFGAELSSIGNQIELPEIKLTIGAACSGINSLISLVTLSIIMTFLLKASIVKRTILVFLSIPTALLANTLRVISVVVVANVWDVNVAVNYFHDISGAISFLIAILLIILWAKLLSCNYRSINEMKIGNSQE